MATGQLTNDADTAKLDKKSLRKLMKLRKADVTSAQKEAEARAVFAHIEKMAQYTTARNILLYHSLPDELPTHEVISKWSKEKKIFLPRVNGNDLDVVAFDGDMSSDNKFNISEPQGIAVDPSIIDLIIVPAVALSPSGMRLGRGKGFYDRLLCTTRAFTIGVALDCQLIEHLPTEPHDIPLDAVITSSHHRNIPPMGQTQTKTLYP